MVPALELAVLGEGEGTTKRMKGSWGLGEAGRKVLGDLSQDYWKVMGKGD